jgi:hypothetical protein
VQAEKKEVGMGKGLRKVFCLGALLFFLLSSTGSHAIVPAKADSSRLDPTVLKAGSFKSPHSEPTGIAKVPQVSNQADDLLQFTSGGHILGFRKDGIVIASGDHSMRIEFVNARSVSPVEEPKSADAEKTGGKVPGLGRVKYPGLWDGVTAVYEKSDGGIVRSSYRIDPGMAGNAVEKIRLRYNRPVRIDENGDLVVSYEQGEAREQAPAAWRESDGEKMPIKVAYRLMGDNEIGFQVSGQDEPLSLVIELALAWNTFLGGSGGLNVDVGTDIAVDGSGNVYVTGFSAVSWGSTIRTFGGGNYDAFAAKLDKDGNLIWNTFLGGTGDDYGGGIAVDGIGHAYITGRSSATWGFPNRPYSLKWSVFAAMLNPNGYLVWSTFLGGNEEDGGGNIAIDASNNVYVTGYSCGTWGTPKNGYSSGVDMFAAKLDAKGWLTWNTFLGGSGTDFGHAIAVDGSYVYIAGMSDAAWGNPIIPYTAGEDIFAAKLDTNGNLNWFSFLGGSGTDGGYHSGIAVDASGNVYVVGDSDATWGNPILPYSAGPGDAFVASLNRDGYLLWNTFLGSSDNDEGADVTVDGSANVFVTGSSISTWGSPIRSHQGAWDGFAAILNSGGTLIRNTFLGGSSLDVGRGLAVDGSENVYITGYSDASWGSSRRAYTAGNDAFVAKISSSLAKNDFNGDGQDDVLWRYYGSEGSNVVWYLGDSGGAVARLEGSFMDRPMGDYRSVDMLQGQGPEHTFADPREPGMMVSEKPAQRVFGDPREAGGLMTRADAQTQRGVPTTRDPGEIGGAGLNGVPVMRVTGTTWIGNGWLPAVADTNWEIVGTGDFNADGNVDILWRDYSLGYNVIWYMEGVTWIGNEWLPAVTDTNWKIEATGDFNADGKVDILWRDYSLGYNVIWYMEGVTWVGNGWLPAVTDTNWKIEGTGDFDGDGKVDILWRYYGAGGSNLVWYMDGTTWIGNGWLPAVTDINWKIEGTGDFDGDGKVDILWRDYSLGYNVIWYMDGAMWAGNEWLPAVTDINWRIENH